MKLLFIKDWFFLESVKKERLKFKNPHLRYIKGGDSLKMFKRKKGSGTWHWCVNCSEYPDGTDVVSTFETPKKAKLCSEYGSKENEDK